MTEELLTPYKKHIAELTLVPSTGGIFNVDVNGERIFSKTDTGRFPVDGEIAQLFERFM